MQRYLLFLPREELMAAREPFIPVPSTGCGLGSSDSPFPSPPLSPFPSHRRLPSHQQGTPSRGGLRKTPGKRDVLAPVMPCAVRGWCSARKRESRGVDRGEGSQGMLALAPLFLHQTHTRTNKHPTRRWRGKLFFPVRIITATPVITTRVCGLLLAYNSVILKLSSY